MHAIVRNWIETAFGNLAPFQRSAVEAAARGDHIMVAAPTGSGKTLAAFLPVFSDLATLREQGDLRPQVRALYVSPLRALAYDVERNVRAPLRAMGLTPPVDAGRPVKLQRRRFETFVRTAVRSGDTDSVERRLIASRPPHILLTTPESLAVMLASKWTERAFAGIRWIIIDELHALARDRRGQHLALLLELLTSRLPAEAQRIGLTATAYPIESIARYLVGPARPCTIIDGSSNVRAGTLDIVLAKQSGKFESPFRGRATAADYAEHIARALEQPGQTAAFVNLRREAELLSHALGDREDVEAHHSSLVADRRRRVERRLKAGELKGVIASSSLELGIDIGGIDRTVLVDTPKSVVRTLQRLGRSGHRPGARTSGTFVCGTPVSAMEAIAIRRCIETGAVEHTAIPRGALDVLAQFCVGATLPHGSIEIDALLDMARRTTPYASLSKNRLLACIGALSSAPGAGDPSLPGAPRLLLDGSTVRVPSDDMRALYVQNVGTIGDRETVNVVSSGGGVIGTIEERFAARLEMGDRFLLGGRCLQVTALRGASIIAVPASGRPTVPRWRSGFLETSAVVGEELGRVRWEAAQLCRRFGGALAAEEIGHHLGVSRDVAGAIAAWCADQLALSDIPAPHSMVVESYDAKRTKYLAVHTCLGGAGATALALVFAARLKGLRRKSVTMTILDGSLLLAWSGARLTSAELDLIFTMRDFAADLDRAIDASHAVRLAFRSIAETGFLVVRRAGMHAIRAGRRQAATDRIFDLLAARWPDHPLLSEAKESVRESMADGISAVALLQNVAAPIVVRRPEVASPLAIPLFATDDDDVMSEPADTFAALVDAVKAVAPSY